MTELRGRTKQEVLAELIEALNNAGRLAHPDVALQDLLARERKGSSGIGQGVAIPHACTTAVHQPMIAFGKSQMGIDFQAIDGKPVNLVFLVLGRTNGDSLQLKILGRLAHVVNVPRFLETLKRIKSPRELLTFLKGQEENLGEVE
ncbi:MAG: PTS sugar transporter subunit IIA, partial [Candidatus Aerophobetes bacterium]|nr:PTS sugar transporter subunit IIA [Candidatus Aerophobetes bacterium]